MLDQFFDYLLLSTVASSASSSNTFSTCKWLKWNSYSSCKSLIKSNIDDVKNFSGYPRAGAITAAKFLEYFIGEHKSWAHLDIAGMAMENTPGSSNQVATAFGLHLLLDFIEAYQEEA